MTHSHPNPQTPKPDLVEALTEADHSKKPGHNYWAIAALTPENEHGDRDAIVIERSQDCKDRDVCIEILTSDDGDRMGWSAGLPAGVYKITMRPYGDEDSYDLNVIQADLLWPLAAAPLPPDAVAECPDCGGGGRLRPSDQLRILSGYHNDKLPSGVAQELCDLADEWDDQVGSAYRAALAAAPLPPDPVTPPEGGETLREALDAFEEAVRDEVRSAQYDTGRYPNHAVTLRKERRQELDAAISRLSAALSASQTPPREDAQTLREAGGMLNAYASLESAIRQFGATHEYFGARPGLAFERAVKKARELLSASQTPAPAAGQGVEAKDRARRRIQALGAALSRRDWSDTERAYEAIRDAHDRPETCDAPLPSTPLPKPTQTAPAERGGQ